MEGLALLPAAFCFVIVTVLLCIMSFNAGGKYFVKDMERRGYLIVSKKVLTRK